LEEIMKQASTSRNAAHRQNTDTSLPAIEEVLKKHAEEDTTNPH
jgi:hypothetical protein